MKSVFLTKGEKPAEQELKKAIGKLYAAWAALAAYTQELYPEALADWHFSGEKYGWSYRISDKRRVLLYLLPRDKLFKVAFVFGQKAMDAILRTDISAAIKQELVSAKVYAEGRGIRIDVNDNSVLTDIKQLVAIKIAT